VPFLLAERARSEGARSMRAVKGSLATPSKNGMGSRSARRGRAPCPSLRASNEHILPSINAPSKLACFALPGMAPVLVPLRPSSEHILIVRAPGAKDRHGCQSIPSYRARSASKEGTWSLPLSLLHLNLHPPYNIFFLA